MDEQSRSSLRERWKSPARVSSLTIVSLRKGPIDLMIKGSAFLDHLIQPLNETSTPKISKNEHLTIRAYSTPKIYPWEACTQPKEALRPKRASMGNKAEIKAFWVIWKLARWLLGQQLSRRRLNCRTKERWKEPLMATCEITDKARMQLLMQRQHSCHSSTREII